MYTGLVIQEHENEKILGLEYTKRQCKRRLNAAMTLVIQLSLQTIESLQNGLQPPFWSSYLFPLFSIRPISQASSQHWLCVDTDVCCKRNLTACNTESVTQTHLLTVDSFTRFVKCMYLSVPGKYKQIRIWLNSV